MTEGTNHEQSTSSVETARNETAHGPTYSMARAVELLCVNKDFISQCH